MTISALATASGTLILSVATFGSVRSANRTARAAEQSLLVGLRPVLAVLHGWHFYPEWKTDNARTDLKNFRRLTRDIYVPAGDRGFWQGAFRDPAEPEFAAARAAIIEHRRCTVDLLYGDAEGGQRVISRFSLTPRDDGSWLAAVSHHWNVDRRDPR